LKEALPSRDPAITASLRESKASGNGPVAVSPTFMGMLIELKSNTAIPL
jgi:hypothetical protein